MAAKPTREELEQRIEALEKEAKKLAQTEKELIKSKAMFKAVVESLPFDVFVVDPDGRYVFQNSICKKNWGDLIGKSLENLPVDKKIKYLWMDNNRRALSGQTVTSEVVYDRLDGGKNFYHNIIAPICDGKKILGIVGVLVDISDLKQAEGLLRESEERFRNLTEITSDWIWEVDKNGFYTYVSPKIQDILGYEPEEIFGKTPFDLMSPDEAYRVSKIFNTIAASQKPFDCLENINLHKDGHPVVLETSGIPSFGSDGEFCGYRGIDRDISKRKEAEGLLRESGSKLSAMLSSVGDHMSMVDKNLNIIWGNEIAGKIFGNDIIGKKCYEVYHKRTEPCEPYPCITLRAFQDGKIHEHDTQVIDQDGKTIFFHCTANVALRDKEGKPTAVLEISRDITEKVRAEKALHKAKNELERRVKKRTRALEVQTKGLEEINTAMNVLLKKRQEDKTEVEDNVMTNVIKLVAPYFEKIKKTKLDDQQEGFLSIIELNLNEIISPFTRQMSLKYLNLTPTEIRIANLIRHGSSSKKIAELMNVSPRTIETHRKNIRRKIGLQGQRGNLRSHLLSRR